MNRYVAEYERGVNTAIDAPSEDAADYAAYTYSAVNRMTGRFLGLRKPPAYLRINPDTGMVEALWVDGSYREIAPEGAPYRLPEPEPQRVLTLVLVDLPDRPPVEVRAIPPEWTDEDVERYTNSRSDWVTASVTTIEPIPEEVNIG